MTVSASLQARDSISGSGCIIMESRRWAHAAGMIAKKITCSTRSDKNGIGYVIKCHKRGLNCCVHVAKYQNGHGTQNDIKMDTALRMLYAYSRPRISLRNRVV